MSQQMTTADDPTPVLGRPSSPEPTPSPAAPAGPELTPAEGVSTTDIVLRWLKEGVAALIAIILVGCLVLMVRQAFQVLNAGEKDPSFDRVKDLLLFINPLVGVVIGYYFNRVSTEARAENAERTARGATTTAHQAEAARGEAEAEAVASRTEAVEARSVLEEVIPAAEDVLSRMPAPPPAPLAGAAGAGGGAPDPLAGARANLLAALERARAVAGRPSR